MEDTNLRKRLVVLLIVILLAGNIISFFFVYNNFEKLSTDPLIVGAREKNIDYCNCINADFDMVEFGKNFSKYTKTFKIGK